MSRHRGPQLCGGLSLAGLALWTSLATAQTFSSGSTGALGAFSPTANTTVTLPPDGVLNYTTVTIPAGITVTFAKNAANTPVMLLATGDITIAGSINVSGSSGTTSGGLANFGGAGGPGGFSGGQGASSDGSQPASAGQGPGGGPGGSWSSNNASYGAPGSFVSLLPLFGGSGGGGANNFSAFGSPRSGASGGGGGGAIVLASSTKITLTGAITANGGGGGDNSFAGTGFCGGGGSGGAIRLVAPQITGSGGSLQAAGGISSFGTFGCTTPAGGGRIRIEAFSIAGLSVSQNPTASFSATPGPVTAASTPALINLPTLTISAVGGVAVPTAPTSSYTTADVALPPETTNPVPVTLTLANVPLPVPFTLKLLPQFGAATTVTGTFTSTTATASVTFPRGAVSVLNAFASYTLPATTAALFPLIDGEPVEQVLVAAAGGEPSTITLATRSGKTIPLERLPPEEQLAVARGWEIVRGIR